jgi:hypothetical protein
MAGFFQNLTNGAAKTNEGITGSGIVIIQDAFASVIDNLIANQEFIDLLK